MTTMTVYQRPPVFQRRVAGLGGRMPEVGKIKVGAVGAERQTKDGQGTWRPPVKLPHFRVTTLRRGEDGNFMLDEAVHAALGDKPTEIPIKLLSNDPDVNQVSRRAYYKGRSHLFCQGDGERAWRQAAVDGPQVERECPCEFAAPGGPCKINGIFRCLIDLEGIPSLGGVYVFRTTGRHSVENLYTGMDMILAATRGRLANIPLALGVTVKTMTFREGGQSKTTNFPMVYVRYAGTLNELLNTSLAIATSESSYAQNLRLLEHRMETAATDEVLPEDTEEQGALVEEFYPEANGGDVVDGDTGEVLEEKKSAGAQATPGFLQPPVATLNTAQPDDAPGVSWRGKSYQRLGSARSAALKEIAGAGSTGDVAALKGPVQSLCAQLRQAGHKEFADEIETRLREKEAAFAGPVIFARGIPPAGRPVAAGEADDMLDRGEPIPTAGMGRPVEGNGDYRPPPDSDDDEDGDIPDLTGM